MYYNYFRPHESLEGKTLAEAGKLKYDVKNWADLTKLPVSKQAEILTHAIPKLHIPRIKTPKDKAPSRHRVKREPRGDMYVGRGMVSRHACKGGKAKRGRII